DSPLSVVVARGRDTALADFYDSLWWYALASLLVLIAIVILTATLIVHFRRMERGEAALAAKEAILSVTLAALPDGVRVVDRDLKLIAWNDGLFNVLGVDREAILADPDPTMALTRAVAAQGLYGRGSVDELVARRYAAVAAGISDQTERQLPDGRWIETRSHPMPDGRHIAVYRDMTAQRALEARTAAAEERLRDAIDSMEDGVVLWGPDDRVIMLNAAMETAEARRTFGIKLGMSFDDVVRGQAASGLLPHMAGRDDAFVAERRAQRSRSAGA